MSTADDPAAGRFHIDKRVPVALIATLLVQTGGAIWWAASTTAAINMLAGDQRRIEQRVERIESERDDLKTRVIRIEEKLTGQTDTLQRILRNVERGGEN